MKKWVLGTIIGGSVVGAAGVGVGASLGLVLPKALEAKEALLHFVANEGESSMAHWGNKKLNYIAIGDSETAGFNAGVSGTVNTSQGLAANGYFKYDYLSYADFLANDLKKANRLKNYHNYAISGATINDQLKLFTEHALSHETFKEADLVTVTIGANDLLAFCKMLKLPFSLDFFSSIGKTEQNVVDANHGRESVFPDAMADQAKYNQGQNSSVTRETLSDSIKLLEDMIATNDYSRILNIDDSIRAIIFDMLRRNIGLFVHDLHVVAPHAQIMVLGHAFPFPQWPKEVLYKPRADWNGNTIAGMYDCLMDSMRKGAKTTVEGDNLYTNFMRLDYLPIKKSSAPALDTTRHIFDDYIKKPDAHGQITKDHFVTNAMPNAADIHPSTFGHELMGNALFTSLSPYLNLTDKDETKYYTYSKRFDKNAADKRWMALDENPEIRYTTSAMVLELLNGNSKVVNGVVKAFGEPLRLLIEGTKTSSIFFKVLGGVMSSDLSSGIISILSHVINEVVPTDPTPFIAELDQADAEIKANTKFDAKTKHMARGIIQLVKTISLKTPLTGIFMKEIASFLPGLDLDQFYNVKNAIKSKATLTSAEIATANNALTPILGESFNKEFNPATDKAKMLEAMEAFSKAVSLLGDKEHDAAAWAVDKAKYSATIDQMIAAIGNNSPNGNNDLGLSLVTLSMTNAYSEIPSEFIGKVFPLLTLFEGILV